MKAAECFASAYTFHSRVFAALFQRNGFFGFNMDFQHCLWSPLAAGTGDDGLNRLRPGPNVHQ